MILVDANLLLYAQVDSFEQHAAARRWFGPAVIEYDGPMAKRTKVDITEIECHIR